MPNREPAWWGGGVAAALAALYALALVAGQASGMMAASLLALGGAAALHQVVRRKKERAPLIVIIDGEIGAGKTTLMAHVRRGLEARGEVVATVEEPVRQWVEAGILAEYYEEKPPERQRSVAYEFQTFTFVTRVQATIEAKKRAPGATVYLLERSIMTDRYVFMEMLRETVGPMRYAMYQTWYETWEAINPLDFQGGRTRVVYLKPRIETCQGRVEKRSRAGELAATGAKELLVGAHYQQRLRAAHEAFLEPAAPHPRPFKASDVIVVDGELAEKDFSRPGPAADEIANHIIARLYHGEGGAKRKGPPKK